MTTPETQTSAGVEVNAKLLEALKAALATAQVRSDLNERYYGRPTSEAWVPDARAAIAEAERAAFSPLTLARARVVDAAMKWGKSHNNFDDDSGRDYDAACRDLMSAVNALRRIEGGEA